MYFLQGANWGKFNRSMDDIVTCQLLIHITSRPIAFSSFTAGPTLEIFSNEQHSWTQRDTVCRVISLPIIVWTDCCGKWSPTGLLMDFTVFVNTGLCSVFSCIQGSNLSVWSSFQGVKVLCSGGSVGPKFRFRVTSVTEPANTTWLISSLNGASLCIGRRSAWRRIESGWGSISLYRGCVIGVAIDASRDAINHVTWFMH